MEEPLVKLIIPGRVGILKNSKRIYSGGPGRRAVVLPSSRYVNWEKTAGVALSAQLKAIPRLIEHPLEMKITFYFSNRAAEADLSNMLGGPEDLLQRLGVYTDDVLIHKTTAEKLFGHEPRVEIELYRYHPPDKKLQEGT